MNLVVVSTRMLLQVTKYVQREILNHRCLMHPHVVQFKEVDLVFCNHSSISLSIILSSSCALSQSCGVRVPNLKNDRIIINNKRELLAYDTEHLAQI